MNNQTAILIFANSAKKDAERKSFLSEDIFDALNSQTLKTAKKSGIPYFHFSEEQQIGNSFGERFANAIEEVFAKGYQKVITIGNDTPHLKAHHLIDTFHQLQKNDVVLGPSKDGGFYLMGIKKEHFNKAQFLNLPWQTNRLHQYIASVAASKNLNIRFLETLKEINEAEDIQQIINSFKSISKTVLNLLQRLLFINKVVVYKKFTTLIHSTFFQNFNKGSPAIFA